MFVETKNKEDVLTGVGFMRARNYGRGEVIIPEAVVLHYTAGGKASGTISWLSENEQAYVSAHFVVDRTGVITQMVPTNLKAFHAGISEWKGRRNLNDWSIGIEIANWGLLNEQANGVLKTWSGTVIPGSDAKYATHKYGKPSGYWECFPSAQINAVKNLCRLLCRHYSINIILGHDDVAPGRKIDPGPLFPLGDVCAYALYPKASNENEFINAPFNEVFFAIGKALEQFKKQP